MPEYRHAAEQLGKLLVERKIKLVYGGGAVGLMGCIANAVLEAGGQVVGVIPKALDIKEVAHEKLTQLHIVKSMHERKALMEELSDGFIALPGGFGTFEEFCEIMTWAQLGLHRKPVGILNVGGFYDHLMAMFQHAVDHKFIKPKHHAVIQVDVDPRKLIEKLETAKPIAERKWIDLEQV